MHYRNGREAKNGDKIVKLDGRARFLAKIGGHMRGRPRKPKALKVLQGTFRKDRDGDPASEVPAEGEPRKPTDLKEAASTFWDEIVPGLVAARIARACDTAALTVLCQWWDRYLRFSSALDEIEEPKDKEARRLTIMTGIAWNQFERIAAKFGLTPADRARLKPDATPRRGVLARARPRKA